MVLCAWTLGGCGDAPEREIDAGTFDGSTYRNEYLGMTITFPADWSIQDEQAKQRFRETGQRMLADGSEQMQTAVETGGARTVDLFTVFQHPFGSPVPSNPSISAVAESVAHTPGIETGADYLYHVRRLLANSQVRTEFPVDVYPEMLGGVEFHVLRADMMIPAQTVHQDYYAAIRQGYALVLTIAYTNDQEREVLREILSTLAFAPSGE